MEEDTNTEVDTKNKPGNFFGDKSNFLGLSILVSAIVVSGTLIYVFGSGAGITPTSTTAPTGGVQENTGSASPEVGNAPTLGDENAPVTIVEYSDYECPFCAKFFNESLASVKSQYINTGKVKLVYKDFPLTNIHLQAQKAAEAARCVREELGDDAYWRMHDIIFERQDLLGVSSYKQWARELGANGGSFDNCLDSGRYAEAVENDLNEGVALGVTGTPTFFINGTKVVGAQPFEQIKAVIEQELSNVN